MDQLTMGKWLLGFSWQRMGFYLLVLSAAAARLQFVTPCRASGDVCTCGLMLALTAGGLGIVLRVRAGSDEPGILALIGGSFACLFLNFATIH